MTVDVRAEPHASAELVTQLLDGEPWRVGVERRGWTRVTLAWQPSSTDPAGYPGWVRSADLEPASADLVAPVPAAHDLLAAARTFLGAPYLWGGLTADGIDCSGLVHLAARLIGAVVPRDAYDQAGALPPVEISDARPGDLYFFARPDAVVHHVGVVTGPSRMLHAPRAGAVVVEEALTPDRLATLVAAARLRDVDN